MIKREKSDIKADEISMKMYKFAEKLYTSVKSASVYFARIFGYRRTSACLIERHNDDGADRRVEG